MAAPAGFSQGSSSLNSFVVSDEETFAQLVAKSLKDSSFTAADHVDKNHSGHFKVISFIIRAYRSANPTPTAQQMAVALDQNTLLTRDCVEKLIVAVQNNQTNDTTSSVSLLTQVGWLLGSPMQPMLNTVVICFVAVGKDAEPEMESGRGDELQRLQEPLQPLRGSEL